MPVFQDDTGPKGQGINIWLDVIVKKTSIQYNL
jgi:hypothetical protein